MQLYNENRNQIAEHVGTKSKAQCILHFVCLPVDGFSLENIDAPSIPGSSNAQSKDDHIPIQMLKRLELKLKQFAEIETLLMRECEQMERTQQRLAAERGLIMSAQFGSAGGSLAMGPPFGSAVINENSGSGQQVISGSQQSGYGNNLPVHPHTSLMQQGMYDLGPRAPLSAIHTSSSTPNALFNPGNSQPSLSHTMLRPVSGTKTGLG